MSEEKMILIVGKADLLAKRASGSALCTYSDGGCDKGMH